MKIKAYKPDGAVVANYNGAVPRVGEAIRTFYTTNIYSDQKDLFRVLSVMYDAEKETAIVQVDDSEGLVNV